jgi:hypothetical protein
MCFKGISEFFWKSKVCEKLQWGYCKLCFESVFHNGGIANPTHLIHVVHRFVKQLSLD